MSDSSSSSSILFHNGRIVADSRDATVYEWMVVEHGKIKSLGTGCAPSVTPSHDLEGQLVFPGLIDAHIHVYLTGKSLLSVDCHSASSISDLQSRITIFIQKHDIKPSDKNDVWVTGGGWEQDHLGRYPTRHDLDTVSTTIPVVLKRVCHHICICNTKALEIAGITRDSKDPDGGNIEKDANGELTGILKESATHLIDPFTQDTPAQRRKHVETGLKHGLENGITSVQTNDEGCWPTYQSLADDGMLHQRVFLTIMQHEMNDGVVPKAGTTHGPYLSCHRVKLFADGALGSETAALTLPYKHKCPHTHRSHKRAKHEHNTSPKPSQSPESPNPADKCKGDVDDGENDRDTYGILIHRQSDLSSRVKAAHDAGYRIEMHVIGDRAAGIGLTALESSGMTSTSRPILTHCQVLRSDLLPRMKNVGVIANIQPQFVVTDSRWAQKALHDDLLEYSYAWKTLLDFGIHCAGGSDSPVEYPSPFAGMYAAIYRPEGSLEQKESDKIISWRPHECLTKEQALHLYTTGAAYASGSEATLGSLHVGYAADFVVISLDVWSNPELLRDITKQHITQVWVDGIRRK